MSSDAHLRRDHGTPSSNDPYIDWGPDLPGRYEGGRARALVANAHAVFVTWETATPPTSWQLEVAIGGETLQSLTIPGGASDHWLQVPARSRGEISLVRDGVRVAVLPFATPPEAPSDDLGERWGRVDSHGELHADAVPPDGQRIELGHDELAVEVGVGSSSSLLGPRQPGARPSASIGPD
jgi:hypothetical protein